MEHQQRQQGRLSHRFNRRSPALCRRGSSAATGSVIGAPFNNGSYSSYSAALHDCPKIGRRQGRQPHRGSVGNIFFIIHPLTGEQRSIVCRPIGLMNFSANRLRRASAREEYGHGVIHAVCRGFHLHIFVIFIFIFIDPGIIATGTILAKVRMFKIQPPSFSAMVTQTNR